MQQKTIKTDKPSTRFFAWTALAGAILSLLISFAAFTLRVYPESSASGFLMNPATTIKVYLACAGKEIGERFGDIYCGI